MAFREKYPVLILSSILPPPYLMTEAPPISDILCMGLSNIPQTMDNVQNNVRVMHQPLSQILK
jgi:hypothetical protein